jgi:site-specific DNA-methyltransferase (cytosine-N4-specific)
MPDGGGVSIYYADDSVTLWHGQAYDVLAEMRTSSVSSIVTSPPYWSVRDYGGEPDQLGLEPTSAEYIARLVAVLAEAHRVLADDGTLWLNLGDIYASKANAGVSVGMTRRADRAELIPPRVNSTAEAPYKSLLMIPERVAWAMVQTGWILRNRIVWNKTNAMPESVKDRLSNRHEALFLFVKQPRYWFDLDPIREQLIDPDAGRRWAERRAVGAPPRHGLAGAAAAGDSDFAGNTDGRNPGDVWDVATAGFPEAHFAVMPDELVRRAILSGCRPGGTVLDPFAGSCTTGMVAGRLGRRFVGIDLHRPYLDLAMRTRLAQSALIGGAP